MSAPVDPLRRRWLVLCAVLAIALVELAYLERSGAFALTPPLTAVIAGAGVLGLLVGSFLNVVILRLPPRLQWHWERDARELLDLPPATTAAPPDLATRDSHCPKCGHDLAAYDNIPVLSYVLLRGRCRGCAAPISWQYPAVELLTGTLFALAAWRFGWSAQLPAALLMLALLVSLAGIDVRTQYLPDDLTLPLLWAGLLANLAGLLTTPAEAILGAVVGYGSLWALFWAFKLIRGKEGMGYGDFKLLGALGAWLGLSALLPIVFFAAVAALVIGGATRLLAKGDLGAPLPFGPALAAAGALQLLVQFDAIRWLQQV